jgi:hypothetical protein
VAQATHAQKAITRAITDLRGDLGHAVDPRLWTKDHPWMMVAAAAVGGFAAACAAVPSKDQRTLRKLEKLEEALFGAKLGVEAKTKEEKQKDAQARPGFMATVTKEIIGLIKPLLTSALAAGVSAKVAEPDTNGQTVAQGTAMGAGYGADDGGGGAVTDAPP